MSPQIGTTLRTGPAGTGDALPPIRDLTAYRQGRANFSPDTAARECAGQATLVRSLKAALDAAFEDASGPGGIARATEAALALALELEAFGIICNRCEVRS